MSADFGLRIAEKKNIAFLWDESFLWGVMAYKALVNAGLPFDLVRAEDVRNGCLDQYAALFVPGGWASNKVKALGSDGMEAIKRFVHDGGSYLGFCGGAGLATVDGIGLVPVKRRPTKERVPSFSGRIRLDVNPHPIWEGLWKKCGLRIADCGLRSTELPAPNSQPVFHAWWPSQFVVEDGSVAVLAGYGEALPDSFSSDVNVGDAEANGNWAELERIYEINLDPKRLTGEPAIIEGKYGKGKVILSLVHFDTPDDPNGAAVLKNLWTYLAPHAEHQLRISPTSSGQAPCELRNEKAQDCEIISELDKTISGLIDHGLRNFLWFWRNSMLLQWRRGVRGLEYCTLYIMIKELAELLRRQRTEDRGQKTDEKLEHIRELLIPFVNKAKRLLMLERFAMLNGHITYEKCDDPEIRTLREELFSRSKSHGGRFKELIDEIDGYLYELLMTSLKHKDAR